ncbi:MAG TPA: zinc transporter [Elusimicrobia bacterium]|nr:zinc transporter [Elusimicrobiota bacterium]
MASLSLIGVLTILISEEALRKLLLPTVALAAGAMIGGALFHLIPGAIEVMGNSMGVFCWIAAGFTAFFVLEQFLQWHHCHKVPSEHDHPMTALVLAADALHHLIGGLAIGGAFLADFRLGVAAWLTEACHEAPQELGDFGILVHLGYSKRKALAYNMVSALTFPLGGLLAYAASLRFDTRFLVPFAAGNFLYVAAADLIPEIKKQEHPRLSQNLAHLASFLAGLGLMLATRVFLE